MTCCYFLKNSKYLKDNRNYINIYLETERYLYMKLKLIDFNDLLANINKSDINIKDVEKVKTDFIDKYDPNVFNKLIYKDAIISKK